MVESCFSVRNIVWIAGVDYDPNDLEIRTGESDEESETLEQSLLSFFPW